MTLSARIALAAKLGYWNELVGLVAARSGDPLPVSLRNDAYARGYEDGCMIVRIEGDARREDV